MKKFSKVFLCLAVALALTAVALPAMAAEPEPEASSWNVVEMVFAPAWDRLVLGLTSSQGSAEGAAPEGPAPRQAPADGDGTCPDGSPDTGGSCEEALPTIVPGG